MNIASALLLLIPVASWKVDLNMNIQAGTNTIGTSYDMRVKSDAGGSTSLSCFATGSDMACDAMLTSKSSQGGYDLQKMICKDKKCYTVIRTNSPLVDYKIEVASNCGNFDVKKATMSKEMQKYDCNGSKEFSLFTDGSIKYK